MRYIGAVIVTLFCLYLIERLRFFNRAIKLAHTTPDQVGDFWVGVKNKPVLSVLLIGDSIAAGTGIEKFEESIGGHLATALSEKYYVHLVNQAQAGSWVSDLSLDQVSSHWDLIIVITGSNDLIHRSSTAVFKRYLHRLLRNLEKHSHHVVLVGPGHVADAKVLPFLIRFPMRFRQVDYSKIMSEVAAKHNAKYANPLEHPNSDSYFAADHLHPNALGYEKWFEVIWPCVEESLRLGPHHHSATDKVAAGRHKLLNGFLFWLHTLIVVSLLLCGLFIPFWWVIILLLVWRVHLYLFDGCAISRWEEGLGGLPTGMGYFEYAWRRFFGIRLTKSGAHLTSLSLTLLALLVSALATFLNFRIT